MTLGDKERLEKKLKLENTEIVLEIVCVKFL